MHKMIFRELLLISGILAIITAQNTLYPENNHSQNIIPHHYTIKIAPFVTKDAFRGEYNASLTILNNTQTMRLYSKNVVVYTVVLTRIESQLIQESLRDSTQDMLTDHVYKPTKQVIKRRNKTVTILHFENTLLRGTYTLNIIFLGLITNNDNEFVKIPFINIEENTS